MVLHKNESSPLEKYNTVSSNCRQTSQTVDQEKGTYHTFINDIQRIIQMDSELVLDPRD